MKVETKAYIRTANTKTTSTGNTIGIADLIIPNDYVSFNFYNSKSFDVIPVTYFRSMLDRVPAAINQWRNVTLEVRGKYYNNNRYVEVVLSYISDKS
jgi:hypothetical protein